ncbi:hypothetical protein C9374_004749 [Naegleria lovaniensis]|uniref:B box-type domain-containing protein n=1 Tax=Naegleria lovaniensis TaxID=51637 RepID=A0AA88GQR2_NAELO|nr:uncharacterized protein C9374_004749 [Naegleria lovaniensis]KAG2382782.1 hypothetical protein C9374_004749 [Naegleria lovaniensis]
MRVPNSTTTFCSICANDGIDDIPAEFHCETCHQFLCIGDAGSHSKKNPQHVVKKLTTNMNVNASNVPSVSSLSVSFCQLHQCPINTFCKTCRQIICSGCALSFPHQSHSCVLLSDIDQEMRQEVKKDVQKLHEMKTKWELKCHTDYSSLDQEIVEIEKQKQLLKKEMDTVFDELHQLLKKRHDILNEELDQLCCERICVISKIKELKQQVDKSMKEFDHLDSMTTLEVVSNKINSLEVVLKDFKRMVSEFKFGSVQELHEMKWKKDEKELNELKQQIDKYGTLDSSMGGLSLALQVVQLSNEWLYDESNITISTQDTVVKIIKKRGTNHHFVFNNTMMERGIFQWKVKIENRAHWIGVGVSSQELVESRDFRAFSKLLSQILLPELQWMYLENGFE